MPRMSVASGLGGTTNLGYAEILSSYTLTTSAANVTGLAVGPITVGSRPIEVIFDGEIQLVSSATAAGNIYAWVGIQDETNTTIIGKYVRFTLAASEQQIIPVTMRRLVTNVPAGTSKTYRALALVSTTTNLTTYTVYTLPAGGTIASLAVDEK